MAQITVGSNTSGPGGTNTLGGLNHITAAFKQQFHDSFEIACQQKQSVLEGLVTSRGQIQGASFTINDMDKVEMAERSFGDRFTSTPLVVPKSGTRLAIMRDFDLFVPIEPFDLPKLTAAPDSPYMQLMVAAANRAKDDLIYHAFFDSIQRREETDIQPDGKGAFPTGKGAYTAQVFPTEQTLVAGGGDISGITNIAKMGGLDKGTLINLRAMFMRNFADDEEIYITYNDAMLMAILASPELTNADYMAVQMLQTGNVAGKWLGMNWINYQRLDSIDATGKVVAANATGDVGFKAAVFTKSALHFGTGINYSTDIQTRADLRNIKQLSAQMSFGAGRANEKKVAAVLFKH